MQHQSENKWKHDEKSLNWHATKSLTTSFRRFHKTTKNECDDVTFHRKKYDSLSGMQADVNHWMRL